MRAPVWLSHSIVQWTVLGCFVYLFLCVAWLWTKRLNMQMHTGQTVIKVELWPTTCWNQPRKSACDLPVRLAGSQTTVSNNGSSKPSSNPHNNEHKTARTWLIAKYAPLAIIGAPLCPLPIRAHLEPALLPPQSFPLPLLDSESGQNTSDTGRFSCYCICLFSFVWSLCPQMSVE